MAEPPARNALRDALIAWLVVEALAAAFVPLNWQIPLIGSVGATVLSFAFLYTPIFVAARRGEYIEDYGFRLQPLRRGLVMAAIATAIIWPLFGAGYVAFYELACKSATLLAALPMKGMCQLYGGWAHVHTPAILDVDFGKFVLVQLLVAALPEELFFRGFLLEMLERRFPPKRRVLGGGIGLALVLSSLMFAAVHLPRDHFDPHALATFFPGLLFGWMKSSTRSITASTVTHASCNVVVRVLDLMLRK